MDLWNDEKNDDDVGCVDGGGYCQVVMMVVMVMTSNKSSVVLCSSKIWDPGVIVGRRENWEERRKNNGGERNRGKRGREEKSCFPYLPFLPAPSPSPSPSAVLTSLAPDSPPSRHLPLGLRGWSHEGSYTNILTPPVSLARCPFTNTSVCHFILNMYDWIWVLQRSRITKASNKRIVKKKQQH